MLVYQLLGRKALLHQLLQLFEPFVRLVSRYRIVLYCRVRTSTSSLWGLMSALADQMALKELKFGSEIERPASDDESTTGTGKSGARRRAAVPPPWLGAKEAAALAAQPEASAPIEGRNSTGLVSKGGWARSRSGPFDRKGSGVGGGGAGPPRVVGLPPYPPRAPRGLGLLALGGVGPAPDVVAGLRGARAIPRLSGGGEASPAPRASPRPSGCGSLQKRRLPTAGAPFGEPRGEARGEARGSFIQVGPALEEVFGAESPAILTTSKSWYDFDVPDFDDDDLDLSESSVRGLFCL